MKARFDLVFSYWIFAWYLLYRLFPTLPNPSMALYLGVVANFGIILFLLYYGFPKFYVVFYIGMVFAIKIIPYWSVPASWSDRDVNALAIFFSCYMFYLYLNRTSLSNQWVKMVSLIQNREPFSPTLVSIMEYIFGK